MKSANFLLLMFLPLFLGCGQPAEKGYSPPPLGRLTQIGDGTFSDSLYGLYCESGNFSTDGGKNCERGCGPVDTLERYCSTGGEVFWDMASGAAKRPPLRFASVDLGSCSKIVTPKAMQPDTTMPVWECDDVAMTPLVDFFMQPGRFYLVDDAKDYDLP